MSATTNGATTPPLLRCECCERPFSADESAQLVAVAHDLVARQAVSDYPSLGYGSRGVHFRLGEIDRRVTASLREAGYRTFRDLDAAPDRSLLALHGVGPTTVARIRGLLKTARLVALQRLMVEPVTGAEPVESLPFVSLAFPPRSRNRDMRTVAAVVSQLAASGSFFTAADVLAKVPGCPTGRVKHVMAEAEKAGLITRAIRVQRTAAPYVNSIWRGVAAEVVHDEAATPAA